MERPNPQGAAGQLQLPRNGRQTPRPGEPKGLGLWPCYTRHRTRSAGLGTGYLARGHHTQRSPWTWMGGWVGGRGRAAVETPGNPDKTCRNQTPPCPNHCPAGALVPSPNTGGPGAAARVLPKNCNCLRQPPGREHGTGRKSSSKRSREQRTGRVGLLCHASTGAASSRDQVDAALSR